MYARPAAGSSGELLQPGGFFEIIKLINDARKEIVAICRNIDY